MQKIPPGAVVELEIGLSVMGIGFKEEESLSVQVSDENPLVDEFKGRGFKKPQVEERSQSLQHVHFGSEYVNRIILT